MIEAQSSRQLVITLSLLNGQAPKAYLNEAATNAWSQ